MTVTAGSRHVTASALVIDPDRAVVLLVDHLLSGWRQMPGGHVERDESADEAAVREVAEETGVHAALWIRPGGLTPVPGALRRRPVPLLICEFAAPADPAWDEPAHRHIDSLYVAVADSRTATAAQQAEVSGVHWVPLDCLTAPPVRPDVPVAARLGCDLLGIVYPW